MQPIHPWFGLALSLRVDGSPHGKGSVRVVRVNAKMPLPGLHEKGEVKGVQNPKSRRYEARLADLAKHQVPRPGYTLPLDAPVILRVLSVIGRPGRIRHARWRIPLDPAEPGGRMLCPVTPDWDNIGKSVGDGLKKGGVLRDDARVADGRVVQVYGRKGEDPFVEVYVFAPRPGPL